MLLPIYSYRRLLDSYINSSYTSAMDIIPSTQVKNSEKIKAEGRREMSNKQRPLNFESGLRF